MIKPIKGFDVNVDNYMEALIKEYPRFESVNAGYWLYGKPKELLKGVLEDRKTQLFYIFNIMNTISTMESLHKLNEDFAKEGIAPSDVNFRKANYTVGISQLQRDLEEHKRSYAKTFVFEQLLRYKLKSTNK